MKAGGPVAACRSLVPSNLAGSYSSEGSNSCNSDNEGNCGCIGRPVHRNMPKLQKDIDACNCSNSSYVNRRWEKQNIGLLVGQGWATAPTKAPTRINLLMSLQVQCKPTYVSIFLLFYHAPFLYAGNQTGRFKRTQAIGAHANSNKHARIHTCTHALDGNRRHTHTHTAHTHVP